MIFEATRKAMKRLGLPEGDAFDMPTSTKRFPDGAAYRIECPTVNSAETVAALLDTCLGVSVAASSIVNQQQVVSVALAQPVDELQAYVKDQPACNVDETRWRQGEQTKASWLWVVVTALVTVFHIGPSRRGAVARQRLGEP